jgi:hypothetical protein
MKQGCLPLIQNVQYSFIKVYRGQLSMKDPYKNNRQRMAEFLGKTLLVFLQGEKASMTC